MPSYDLRLTRTEHALLEKSFDLKLTRRRLRLVVGSGLALIVVLIVTSPLIRSWEFLLFFAAVYIAVTTWERVGYARSILAYKRLVQKLAGRLEALEQGRGSSPGSLDTPAR